MFLLETDYTQYDTSSDQERDQAKTEQQDSGNQEKSNKPDSNDQPTTKEHAVDRRTLIHTRRLARELENDHFRDQLEDNEKKKRMEWDKPGGLSKLRDEYAEKDEEGKPSVLAFLTSSDPMEGLGRMVSDKLAYNMERMENKGQHKKTNKSARKTFEKHMGYSKKDAKLLADVLETETRYGTDALNSARQKAFMSQKGNNKTNDKGEGQPSFPI